MKKTEEVAICRPRRETNCANLLILDFWPPNLWANEFLMFKPPSLWYLVMAAWAAKYKGFYFCFLLLFNPVSFQCVPAKFEAELLWAGSENDEERQSVASSCSSFLCVHVGSKREKPILTQMMVSIMPDIKPDAIKAQRKAKFILRSRGE